MTSYKVMWAIDVDSDTPRNAAKLAQFLQQAPDTTATVFEVAEVVGMRTMPAVEVDLLADEDEPDERLVPDFVLDLAGVYNGNAYPSEVSVRIGITVLGTGEDYGLTVETADGSVIGSMTLDRDEADGIIRMASTDNSLSGYEDDWKIPAGMDRQIIWVLPTEIDYEVMLNGNQIDEVAEWFSYAVGEQTWDWAEQGEEWSA